jgi:hypothetical protein
MKITILPALMATCALTVAGPAYAQRGHGSQPHAPKAPTTHVQSGAATAHGGQTHGGAAAHGAAATTHGASAHATTTKTKGAKATTVTTTRTTRTTTTSGSELTPVQQKLQKNTNLAAKLQGRLPAGMTVQDASFGFRNLGQFVAAVNVSNNLGIPFAQLKAKMTGDNAMSLGQAIHALRPTVDADAESRTAQRQAEAMVAGGR